jgi:integrase
MSKQAVKVEVFKGRLRLRWSYRGSRYCLSVGLYDSPLARKVAAGKANLIEVDLVTDNFDQTLRKYQGEPGDEPSDRPQDSGVKVVELFQQFFQARAKRFTGNTRQKYEALAGKIAAFFEQRTVGTVDEATADRFRVWMAEGLQPITQSQYLGLMSACWGWGLKQALVSSNPWVEVIKIKVPPQQRAKPFTTAEMIAILTGFRANRYYSYYTDFVEFLFSTGCCTGEAIGLCWAHLPEDCTKVWIGESVSGGIRKATKTNQAREFRLNQRLSRLLLARRPADYQPKGLVFPALKGGVIDARNFRNRAWVTVLAAAGVSYRKPYNTRHTFISHALAQGLNPITIAQMTGHDPEILFKHYAADIQGGLQLPDII